jgi:GNAT superfamily N-acetyltransferase
MASSGIWVGEIDVDDDEVLRRWWEAGQDADADGRPYAAYWALQSAKVALRSTTNPVEQHALAAIEDGEILGINQVGFPLLDNRHVAFVEPLVRPSCRGRGVGTALLHASLGLTRERARTTAMGEVHMPLDALSPGHHFMTGHGFEAGIVDIHRILELPVDDATLDRLAQAAAPHHADYQLVTIGDVVPDEYMDGFCSLAAMFNSEAPMGDLDIEPEVWDMDRVRRAEENHRAQGRHSTAVLALDRDGTPVAITLALMADSQPDIGWQAITLVSKEHRGHRLGMAVKAANTMAYQRRFPTVRVVHSWNAEENGPMVAINDALGFRPVERLVEMQLKL